MLRVSSTLWYQFLFSPCFVQKIRWIKFLINHVISSFVLKWFTVFLSESISKISNYSLVRCLRICLKVDSTAKFNFSSQSVPNVVKLDGWPWGPNVPIMRERTQIGPPEFLTTPMCTPWDSHHHDFFIVVNEGNCKIHGNGLGRKIYQDCHWCDE